MNKRKVRFVAAVRLVFLLLVLASTFAYAMFQGGTVSWSVFYIVLPFVSYSLALYFYPLSQITVERNIRTPNVENGSKVVVDLTLNRKSRFPLLYTVVLERWMSEKMSETASRNSKKLFIFGFKKQLQWQYEVENMLRGEHVLEGVTIEVSDFFGWIQKTVFIEQKQKILVFPKITDIHYVPVNTQYDRGSLESPLAIIKDTTMVAGVRDYQAGDRVTWIHWKSFARTQSLMTKEFEDRRSQDLFVVMDGKSSFAFEEQVELAASLLTEATRHQENLSFLTTGEKPVLFSHIQSEEQLRSSLVHLAKIQPSTPNGSNGMVDLGSTMQHFGTVLLITGDPDRKLIESMLLNATNRKSIICFVVKKYDGDKWSEIEKNIKFAETKGVTMQVLKREAFLHAFKEVTRG